MAKGCLQSSVGSRQSSLQSSVGRQDTADVRLRTDDCRLTTTKLFQEGEFLSPNMVWISLRRLPALLVDPLDVLRPLEIAHADPVDRLGRGVRPREPFRDLGIPAARLLPRAPVEGGLRGREPDLGGKLVGRKVPDEAVVLEAVRV